MNTEANTLVADGKIIDRVRKLFAMSQDASSLEEAAIALKRYQSLVAKYGIQESDLETSEFGTATGEALKKMERYKGWLALGIAPFTNTVVAYEFVRVDGVKCKRIKYEGFKTDVQQAIMLQDYLEQTLARCLKAYKKESGNNGLKAATSFKNGFASALQDRMVELAAEAEEASQAVSEATSTAQGVTSGTSLVVCKMKMVEAEFGKQKVAAGTAYRYDYDAKGAGSQAAQNVSLNRQVSGEGQRRLSA